MTIESQWKDPKKRNRNIVIGLIIAIVVVYGYFMCWFGGTDPVVYDLNWCPNSCYHGGPDCGGSSGGGSCGTCPSGETCDCDNAECPDCPVCDEPTYDQYTCGSPDDGRCGGTCPPSYSCDYTDMGCSCVPEQQPCGWHESDGPLLLISYGPTFGYCYGACPQGQYCMQDDRGYCTCETAYLT